MKIRQATELDIPELADLYSNSVRAIASEYYSPEQVSAWAAIPLDPDFFRNFILDATTLIAEKNEKILGFAGIKDNGHIVSVYVHSDYLHRGIGSLLLGATLELAKLNKIVKVYAEASEFSKPLFEKFGFKNYDIEQAIRNGVKFDRYLMERYF